MNTTVHHTMSFEKHREKNETIECLFELYGEEIPARFQENARTQFKTLFEKQSTAFGLAFHNVITHVTPMRLVLCAHVAPHTPAQKVEKRGPRVGAPEQALGGFCQGAGVSRDELIEQNGYYVAHITTPAQSAQELLPEIFAQILKEFSWPKTMRWPGSTLPWVRPVRHIMALLNGKHLSFDVPFFGLSTTSFTYGHRFLSHAKIEVSSFSMYKEKLEIAHVIVDQNARKERIKAQLLTATNTHDLILIPDEPLLEEVTGLVEYPGLFLGKIDPALLSTPEIVMITSMRVHQKCFAFRNTKGSFAPYFAAIINTIPKDSGKALAQGYEMGMLKARLEDARFFYELDLKIPLEVYIPKLDTIIYHEKLGTLGDKVRRQTAASSVYTSLFGVDESSLKRATSLAKCDLLTQMVGEFAELQGIMGEIYARAQGEKPDVAGALLEHYKPLGPNDHVPSAPLSVALALMDKMDTLVGFIGVGILPTGSKDPFALRRAALGMLRLILENKLNLDLKILIKEAIAHYPSHMLLETTENDVLDFLMTRFSFVLKDQGISHDVVAACLENISSDYASFHPVNLYEKVQQLNELLLKEEGKGLLSVYRRAANILEAERKKDKRTTPYSIDENLLTLPAEENLIQAAERFAEGKERQAPSPFLSDLVMLHAPIQDFFDTVMVNDACPEIRLARLGMLEKIVVLFHQQGINFSMLEG